MSTHVYTLGGDAEAERQRIVMACHDAGQGPIVADLSGSTLTLIFIPDLGPAKSAALDSLVRAAKSVVGLTSAERDALETDIATLRAYYQNASPTNAQSVAAIKSIIAVLRAAFRD